MLSHPDPTIQNDAVIALNNLVLGGARRTANATIMAKTSTLSNMSFDKFAGSNSASLQRGLQNQLSSRNSTTGPIQPDPNAKGSNTVMMSQNSYLAYLRPHPYFNEMDTCGGIDRLFDIYTHTRDKLTERNCAVCIGRLFRARILPLKFSPIIDYLKTSSQETEKGQSGGAQLTANAWNSIGTLVYLAGKESNHSNILRDNYLQFLVSNLRSRHPKGAVHFTLLLLVTMIKAGMVGTIATFGQTSQNDTRSQIRRAIPLSALRALAVPPPTKSSAKKQLKPGEVDDEKDSQGEDDEVTLQAKALLEELK
ncbi:MAG: hypothetical protein EZS28_000419 [Streblomastix strix]|nr:MAG: hypothetical protein EZS28_000419 [Streblomastix strix]